MKHLENNNNTTTVEPKTKKRSYKVVFGDDETNYVVNPRYCGGRSNSIPDPRENRDFENELKAVRNTTFNIYDKAINDMAGRSYKDEFETILQIVSYNTPVMICHLQHEELAHYLIREKAATQVGIHSPRLTNDGSHTASTPLESKPEQYINMLSDEDDIHNNELYGIKIFARLAKSVADLMKDMYKVMSTTDDMYTKEVLGIIFKGRLIHKDMKGAMTEYAKNPTRYIDSVYTFSGIANKLDNKELKRIFDENNIYYHMPFFTDNEIHWLVENSFSYKRNNNTKYPTENDVEGKNWRSELYFEGLNDSVGADMRSYGMYYVWLLRDSFDEHTKSGLTYDTVVYKLLNPRTDEPAYMYDYKIAFIPQHYLSSKSKVTAYRVGDGKLDDITDKDNELLSVGTLGTQFYNNIKDIADDVLSPRYGKVHNDELVVVDYE